MRVLVMYDLPTNTKRERRSATQFRNYLLNEGYVMMQYSVYYRVCNGYDMAYKYRNKLKKNIPSDGSIRMMIITEKQFEKMELLIGDKSPTEKKITSDNLTLF